MTATAADVTAIAADVTATAADVTATAIDLTVTAAGSTAIPADLTPTAADFTPSAVAFTVAAVAFTPSAAGFTPSAAGENPCPGVEARNRRSTTLAATFAVAISHLVMPTKIPANTDTKPNLPWDVIAQAALKAQKLAGDNAAALGSRVTPAFLAAFATDITALGVVVPTVITTKKGAVQLTAAQKAALVVGHNLVIGIRQSVKTQASPEVQLAYGVGTSVNPRLVKSVRSALDTIGKRIAAQPVEAAGFGITADDATAVTNAIGAIDASNQAQTTARATSPKATQARNATARRLLAGIRRISGAGMRVFAENPTLFDAFAALTKKAA